MADPYYASALDEARRCIDEDVAAPADVDLAMRHGCGWSAGPLEWAESDEGRTRDPTEEARPGARTGAASLIPSPSSAPSRRSRALDPLGFAEAWTKAAAAAGQNPAGVMEAWARYWSGMAEASTAAIDRAAGEETAGPVQPGRKDRRFRDPAWEENPAFFGLLQAYLLASRLVEDLRDASSVDAVTDERLGFLSDVVMDALAPTNNFWTNPAAMKRALDTGGASVARGMQTLADDVANNQGMPRQIDPDAFVVGRDLAVTPGQGRLPQRPDGADPVRAGARRRSTRRRS